MSDLHVLQPGPSRHSRRRRTRRAWSGRPTPPQRRPHLLVLALGVVVVVVVVLLVLDVSAATRTTPHSSRSIHAQRRVKPAGPAKPAQPVYGETRDRVQVSHPHLQLPLRAGLVFDVRTGRVLWARAPGRILPIASLTKMMTALVTVEHSSPQDRVLITRQAVDFSGSGVGLLPRGKRVQELPLLYGLLLPSGNDAAIALAQHVAGTQSKFVAMMNAQAAAMHLSCTHFSNVSGVVDRDNHSCARDLAVLAHAVLSQPLLRRIVGSSSAVLRFPIKGGKLYLYNNNPLLMARYPGTDGVKTGYTTAAGMCLVATARRDGAWLGAVLLHSGNWYTQGMALLNAGFAAVRRATHKRSEPRRSSSAARLREVSGGR